MSTKPAIAKLKFPLESVTMETALRPKVAAAPKTVIEVYTSHQPHTKNHYNLKQLWNGTKKKQLDWDITFSLTLIILIIIVNASLALMLNNINRYDQTKITEPFITFQAGMPAEKTKKSNKTITYITHQEKQILLKELKTPVRQTKKLQNASQ